MPDDARDRLKAMMADWPYISEECKALVASLPWRHREAVILAYGRQLPRPIVASRLGVSETTVSRDLSAAARRLFGREAQ